MCGWDIVPVSYLFQKVEAIRVLAVLTRRVGDDLVFTPGNEFGPFSYCSPTYGKHVPTKALIVDASPLSGTVNKRTGPTKMVRLLSFVLPPPYPFFLPLLAFLVDDVYDVRGSLLYS